MLVAQTAHHNVGEIVAPTLPFHVKLPGGPEYQIDYTLETSPAEKANYAEMLVNYDRSKLANHNDAHMHPWSYTQKGVDLKQLINRMDNIKCKNTVVMPIPTSIVSKQGDAQFKRYELAPGHHHCGEPYYVPTEFNKPETKLTEELMQHAKTLVELAVDSEVDDQTAKEYRKLTPEEQDRLDPMITGLHLGSTYADISVFKKLARNPGVFTGGGELTLNKEMVEELFAGEGQASLHAKNGKPSNIEPAKQMMAAFGVAGMPVTIHCDVDTWRKKDIVPGKPKNLEAFKNFISDPKCANTKIIWAHAGGLGRFVKQPQGHLNELQGMLDANKHLVLDISWSQVAKQLTGTDIEGDPQSAQVKQAKKERLEAWVGFIEKNSDRIMFGSDTLAPKSSAQWSETLVMYHELLGKLSDTAKQNVLEASYENHIKAARSDVRKFENHVLPLIEDKLTDLSVQRLDLDKIRELRDAVYAELGDKVSAEKPLFPEQLKTELDKAKRNSNIIAGVGQHMINKSEEKLHAASAQLHHASEDLKQFKELATAYKKDAEAYKSDTSKKEAQIAELQYQLDRSKRKNKWAKGIINAATTALPGVKERMVNYKIGSGRIGDPRLPRSVKDSAPAQQPVVTTRGQRLDQLQPSQGYIKSKASSEN